MNQNMYDNDEFFSQYSQMDRSQKGLAGAGEWHTLKELLPDFKGKDVLDLGCGFGWHCIYAAEHGAASVIGVDLSEKMLAVAKQKTDFPQVTYLHRGIEEMDFADDQFDVVLSSLTLHYLPSFEQIARKVSKCLKANGTFIFSVEHPLFTAEGTQDWYYDERGEKLHYPLDHYFDEGQRQAQFLGSAVTKYHKTLTTYLDGLLTNGFQLQRIVEPTPPQEMMDLPEMQDELRRPMMLIVSATNGKSSSIPRHSVH